MIKFHCVGWITVSALSTSKRFSVTHAFLNFQVTTDLEALSKGILKATASILPAELL